MRQALVLCGGKAKRLQPYSYILPKASFPFLNLPLLAFPWFYLEKLKVSHFLLNSHLFPEKLENTIHFLSQPSQKINLFFEREPLGSAGTLLQLKKKLQKEKDFVYINGDSLFIPSQTSHILAFEKTFFNLDLDALFFVTPFSSKDYKKALWCDKDYNLKCIDSTSAGLYSKGLFPFFWSGMALFKSSLLDSLKKPAFDLFQDFVLPLLKSHKIKVYADPLAVLLELGDKDSYLKAMQFCLNCLFQFEKYSKYLNFNKENVKAVKSSLFKTHLENENLFYGFRSAFKSSMPIKSVFEKMTKGMQLYSSCFKNSDFREEKTQKHSNKISIKNQDINKIRIKAVKKLLTNCFNRFDPSDSKVGFKNGQTWSQIFKYPVLMPKSVQGLNFLKLQGPSVIGSELCFFSESVLDSCVLDSQIAFKGFLQKDILIKTKLF